jgi:hypothetical protein
LKLFCPSCGSPVEFRYDDSFVRVCAACRSAIVRTDRGIDSFGQVADLTPPRSGLALGDRGKFRGTGFELVGRSQYGHPAGGTWEEWYLRLDDGRWAWLGEAQGAWVVTFPRPAPDALPAFEELRPGMQIPIGDPPSLLEVGECNTGTLIGAEGEIPFQFTPGSTSRFADLGDERGRFATLDYGAPGDGDTLSLFVGLRSTLAALELSARAPEEEREISGQRLSCPHCGGSIELRVPGRSLSVACQYCGSILDCEGPLAILSHPERKDTRQPFPLGAVAEFEGVRYLVTGRLRRRAVYEGVTVEWDEWLLYERTAGYRWLARAKGHYSFVTPLSPGSVRDYPDHAYYRGQRFQLYDAAHPSVIGVWGEFYWKVTAGETVASRDFIAPPAMLSCEASENELHWSLGIYQTHEQIRRAFGLEKFSDTSHGVAGNQPFRHAWIARVTAVLAIAFFAVTFLRAVMADGDRVYSGKFRLGGSSTTGGILPSEPAIGGQPTYVLFTPEFDLAPRENVRITLNLPVNNSWAYAIVDLIHDESGELRTFASEISYYYGTEGGESWSEGGPSTNQVLAAGRSGRHLLRIELQTPAPLQLPLDILVEQNVFVWSQFGWAFLILSIPALCLGIYQWGFEKQRWSESDFAPGIYAGQSDD